MPKVTRGNMERDGDGREPERERERGGERGAEGDK